MSSLISITAPRVGITFCITSGVAFVVNIRYVSIFKKSETKCQKYSSIIKVIQRAIFKMNLGGALGGNNIPRELEIITEHYPKYRDKIKEVQTCYTKKEILKDGEK